jgi:hypothetical protein
MDLAMSALPLEAGIRAGLQDVCFVPKHITGSGPPHSVADLKPLHTVCDHFGNPAFRRPSASLARSWGRLNGHQSLRLEIRNGVL